MISSTMQSEMIAQGYAVGCYKLLGCVYLKILLVIITMAHLRAVDNCAGLIDICLPC